MLIELRIQNYAVIERLAVRLDPGLNVLTGETGAGKSIIVGALSLLLGERATSDVVRSGADRAVVEGVFDAAARPELEARLAEQGIEADDGLLILRREVAVEGRNRAWVNGSATTAAFLGTLGRLLIDLHGQHESQTLLAPDAQRAILDAFGGAEAEAVTVRDAHARARAARAALEELEARRREAEQRVDLLRFQAEEIERAAIELGEEPRLEEEARRLEHAEELARIAGELHQALYAADRSLTERLGEARRRLEQLLRIDAGPEAARELLDSAYYGVEEVGRRMGDYAAGVEHDPTRLDALRRRQDLLFRLKTKYGPELSDVVEVGARARRELDLLDGAALERKTLDREAAAAEAALAAAAARLSSARAVAAASLALEVEALLPELGLSGSFIVSLEPAERIGADGAETVEFRVSLNAGLAPGPLSRVASGGELSRIMLALKTILARLDRVPTLVFDEIDVGIGGRVAARVAERLRSVAGEHQVFVITHLAQLAARADHQLLVEKVERAGTTLTRVTEQAGEARVRELARMLGGDPESAVSREHARALLSEAAPGRALV